MPSGSRASNPEFPQIGDYQGRTDIAVEPTLLHLRHGSRLVRHLRQPEQHAIGIRGDAALADPRALTMSTTHSGTAVPIARMRADFIPGVMRYPPGGFAPRRGRRWKP